MKTQKERINYARAFIISGKPTTRAFDSCFEQFDGEEVYQALKTKALAFNPEEYAAFFNGQPIDQKAFRRVSNLKKLRDNFNRYLSPAI